MSMIAMKNWIKTHNVELQFWGYEIGNLLAAVAGVGGFIAFANSFGSVDTSAELTGDSFFSWLYSFWDAFASGLAVVFNQKPDFAVSVCIALIVIVSPVVRMGLEKISEGLIVELYDYSVAVLAVLVLGFALSADASWITVSGSSFVVASSFLRHGLRNPLFLKLGGMLLQTGGIALGIFGFHLTVNNNAQLDVLLGCLTIATGFYVTMAGILTYIGGKIKTDNYQQTGVTQGTSGAAARSAKLFHPVNGLVSMLLTTLLDTPYSMLRRYIVNPSIFWVSHQTKTTKPFITSMAARLPWRLFTGVAALATGTDAGVAFALANFFWALGDVAIGSIDWHKQHQQPVVQSDLHRVNSVLTSGSAVLLLPGSVYPNGSKSIMVSKLELAGFDTHQFLDNHENNTSICFVDRHAKADQQFGEDLKAHLFR